MVNFGMMISLAGYFLQHLKSRILGNWFRITALVLTVLSFLSFAAGFVNMIETPTAQRAMLMVMFLYMINGY